MPPSKQELVNVVDLVKAGRFSEIDQDTYHVFRHRVYHRVSYAGTELSIDLFNASASSGRAVTNLKNGGQFDNDLVCFQIQAPRIQIDWGATIAGAPNNANVTWSASTAVSGILPLIQTSQQVMANGHFSLKVGKRDLVLPTPGLFKFPAGEGFDGLSALATTVAATSCGGAQVNNGVAAAGNAYPLVPYVAYGGENVSGKLEWMAANATSTGIVFKVELEGVAVVVASR